ncbi:M23 family metallopeptidase [Lactonifactor longoviformis]|uniref:Peptidase family M23 n=1 Tax=Lactonifactor longoviformis DSM 17459 TaxID=1122155 RepID=A0A1M4WV26_9CLOT|nr:M23 family metallopeptidase [Lactonifactor longoviformis]SHE85048.1 Peptidase family M23 [Lactonifactor longoviformis DSM 17459]
MRKTFFLLVIVLFFDIAGSTFLGNKAADAELKKMGIPLGFMREHGINREEMRDYGAFWKDLKYFPLPSDLLGEEFSYEDTWMEERSYGGNRKHEGCDIFGSNEKPGYYPVLSMTDGTVEKVGWLPLGGYRIGVRSPSGGYFYYAHLYGYARDFREGDAVKGGELLGFMGDTGYGEEGTTGKFPPHLHLGIYIEKEDQAEYPVDPYIVLKYLEKNRRRYLY